MNNIFYKPFIIFWAVIPVIISIGITNSNETIDINVHDTYFVINYKSLGYLVGILFGIIGLGYWIMFKLKRRLSKWLNATHVITTWIGILGILISSLFFGRSYIESENPIFDGTGTLNLIITIFVLIIIIGQLFYLANLIIGLVGRSKNSR